MALWIAETDELVIQLWTDAPTGVAFDTVVESAQDQCEAYAPTLAVDAVVPARYKVALIMQARAVQRALLAGADNQIGPDGMSVTVWPMDRTVKAMLRPPKPRLVH